MLNTPLRYSKWRTPKETKLIITQFGEDYIVFNHRSGDTHQLNRIAVDALKAMQEPQSLPLLYNNLSKHYLVEDNEDLFHHLEILIKEFDNLGLIEPT